MGEIVEIYQPDTTKVEAMRWRQAAARYRKLYHEQMREKWQLMGAVFIVGLLTGITGAVGWML